MGLRLALQIFKQHWWSWCKLFQFEWVCLKRRSFFCRVILVKALWASDRWIKSVFQTANSVLCLSKGTGDVWWQRGACFASSITPNVVLVTGCLLQCICQNVSLVSDEYNIFCASINVDWMSFTPPFPLLHLLYQSLWHILLDLTEIAVSLCLFWESYG